MKKLTYTNSANGLSMEFSSDSRTMHLDLRNFDGCSVGASAVTYKPVGLPGEKLITGTLNSRTIILPVEFTATDGGKYSRTGALAIWEQLLRTFQPLNEGWLVWTDGTQSRRIKCRTAETPKLTQVLPFLFSSQISLIADFPYWESTEEHSVSVAASASAVMVDNTCGIAVPLCIDVPSGGSQPLIYNRTSDCGLSFSIAPEQSCTVDTRECTVTLADGSYANHLLSADSEFFTLLPGSNELQILGTGSGSNTAVIRWRDLFMGVY